MYCRQIKATIYRVKYTTIHDFTAKYREMKYKFIVQIEFNIDKD